MIVYQLENNSANQHFKNTSASIRTHLQTTKSQQNTLKNFDPQIRNSIFVHEVCQKAIEDNDASVSVPYSRLGQPMKVQ
jgi:hypothetical protein